MTAQKSGLLRPKFFERQQLSANDLNAVIDYIRQRDRRHNRYLHGWGVVCGLQIVRGGSPWEIAVQPGYALSPSGEEIFVAEAQTLLIEQAVIECRPDAGDPCLDGQASTLPGIIITGAIRDSTVTIRTHNFPANMTFQVRMNRAGTRGVGGVLVATISSGAGGSFTGTYNIPNELKGQTRIDIRLESGEGYYAYSWFDNITSTAAVAAATHANDPTGRQIQEVYLAVRPNEEDQCGRPAMPEPCHPAGQNYFPTRVRETHEIKVLCCLPDTHKDPARCSNLEQAVCEEGDLPCPPESDGENWVILAAISVTPNGIQEIDGSTHRRRIYSQELTSRFLDCLCDQGIGRRAILGVNPEAVTGTYHQGVSHPLVITGVGLRGANAITFSGSAISGTVIDNTDPENLRVSVLLQAGHSTGPVSFQVRYPDGRVLNSTDQDVFLTVSLPPLRITGIAPASIQGHRLLPTTHLVTIQGEGLNGASGIFFTPANTTLLTINRSTDTQITATLLVPLGTSTGNHSFTVVFPDARPSLNSAAAGVFLQLTRSGGAITGGGVLSDVRLSEATIDVVRAVEQPVDSITGIGSGLGGRLAEANVNTIADFVVLPDEVAAEIMKTSPENVIRLKQNAISLIRR
jgi:hypothetical protein